MTNTISFIAIQHMKSQILGEQNSQLVLIHIWLVICLKAFDSMNKQIYFSILVVNLVKKPMRKTYSKKFSHQFNERSSNHLQKHINLQLVKIYFLLNIACRVLILKLLFQQLCFQNGFIKNFLQDISTQFKVKKLSLYILCSQVSKIRKNYYGLKLMVLPLLLGIKIHS